MDSMDYLLSMAEAEAQNEDYSSYELESTIKYHNITHDDMLNGDGLRVVLWVAGCEHHCKECHNPCTWDANGGAPLTQWDEAEFWKWLNQKWTQGATFSGGDPLHPANRDYIAKMMKKVKGNYQNKDIWCYTGYVLRYSDTEGFYFENSATGETFVFDGLSYIDVLVDGPFQCDVRRADIAAKKKVLWRGSSNQRIIDIQASIKEKKIILKEENNGY